MERYRVVLYSSRNGVNLTTISEPLYTVSSAEKLLDEMRAEDLCTGGHIEELIDIAGKGRQWHVCTEV